MICCCRQGGANAAADKKKEQEEEIDIDLNDPDVEKAALKIQAQFKGFKGRKSKSSTEESKVSWLLKQTSYYIHVDLVLTLGTSTNWKNHDCSSIN